MTAPGDVVPHSGWQLARAGAFALVCVGTGILGHAAQSGQAPDVTVILLGGLLAVLCGWKLSTRRRSLLSLLVGVLALQAAIHLGSELHASLQPAAGHAHERQPGFGDPAVGMLVAHALATALGVAVLLRLEQRAWRAVRRIARAVLHALPGAARRPRLPTILPPVEWVESRLVAGSLAIASVAGCRGPPGRAVVSP